MLHEFLHELRWSDIPADMQALARQWLLDLSGVAAGGAGTPLSRIIRDHAAAQFGPGERSARMLMDGRKVSPAGAALAGGMTIDALDAHDGHRLTKGHAGCGVMPAALALAEAEGREDGAEFLTSIVLGYEIGTRAGIALHRTAPDYHTSGAWVAVACAALGARALGLGREPTREAVGIAEYHGPRSQMMRCIDHPTMVKDGSGWGAMAGVSAAYLAAAEFTGAPALTVESPEIADLWSDLGSCWRIAEQYYKPHPICRWAQPSVQAILQLRAAHGLAESDVAGIEIDSFHQAVRLAIRHPRTTEEAQYSTSFAAAAAMARGRVGPDEVGPTAFADPAIARLAAATTIREHADFSAAFPARRIASVTLVLNDGRRIASGPTEARFDPEAPVTIPEVRAKYRAYATPVLGASRSTAIEQAVEALGAGGDVMALADLLTAPAGADAARAA